MKKIIFLLLFINILSYSQFYELNTGVSTQLNSVTKSRYGAYTWTVWACGNNGTIVKGISQVGQWNIWRNLTGKGVPVNVNLTNICAVDTLNAWVTYTTGNITYVWKTSNGGYNWVQVFSQANGFMNAVYMRNSLKGFMEGNPVGARWSLWKTNNGGLNWDSTGLYLPQAGTETGFSNSFINPVEGYAMGDDTNKIWFGTNNSRIYYSGNYGQTWAAESTSPEQNIYCFAYRFSYPPHTLYAGGSNYILSSTNYGSNWTSTTVGGSGNITGISCCTFSTYLTRGNQMYSLSSSWTLRYTAPSGSYTYSDNRGSSDNGIDHYAVRANGGMTFLVESEGIQKISSDVPKKFTLFQNYPNPFNPTTKIKFEIPSNVKSETSNVKIIIYDIMGNEVATLVNDKLLPGTYEVEWDASNYASGVYYYKLQAGDFSETRKMVLIK